MTLSLIRCISFRRFKYLGKNGISNLMHRHLFLEIYLGKKKWSLELGVCLRWGLSHNQLFWKTGEIFYLFFINKNQLTQSKAFLKLWNAKSNINEWYFDDSTWLRLSIVKNYLVQNSILNMESKPKIKLYKALIFEVNYVSWVSLHQFFS